MVAKNTVGSNLTVASGTLSVMAGVVGMVIVCPVKVNVTALKLGRLAGVSTAVNQM